MDANDNLDPELSWGFVGGDDADTNNRSYLFGGDYKESTILSEFGWNIPGDYYGCGHGFSDLDLIDSDFAGSGADGRASAPPSDDVFRSGEETVVVVEENSTSASVLGSNPSMSSSSLEDPSEKSTVSGSSTAANPPPDTASKGKKKGEKRNGEARFAFVTKSEIDNLEDGYRWRKYGQKAVKNSGFPRSYYRCTNSKCRVKKRVERWWEDPSVVITTYEGQHCHESVGGTRAARRPLHHILPNGSYSSR